MEPFELANRAVALLSRHLPEAAEPDPSGTESAPRALYRGVEQAILHQGQPKVLQAFVADPADDTRLRQVLRQAVRDDPRIAAVLEARVLAMSPAPASPVVSAPPVAAAQPSASPPVQAVPSVYPTIRPMADERTGWPSLAPTIVITILFGIFGLIPAYLHTEEVRRRGGATSRYWKAFGFTILGSVGTYVLLVVILIAAVAASVNNTDRAPSYGAAPVQAGGQAVPAQSNRVVDAAGDLSMPDGADLTAFAWDVAGGDARLEFTFDGPFDGDHNVTLYLRTAAAAGPNNCPGLPGADIVLTITEGNGVVSAIDPAGPCANRTAISDAAVTATSSGWVVDVPASTVGLDGSGGVTARVLSATQTGPDTETVIQDELPDADQAPVALA